MNGLARLCVVQPHVFHYFSVYETINLGPPAGLWV